MPFYEWKGMDAGGRNRKGVIDAETLLGAKGRLKGDGVFLTDIYEVGGERKKKKGDGRKGSRAIAIKRVKEQEVVIMTRLLANLVKANIPLVEALSAIIDQVENPHFKWMLTDVRDSVREGESLSDALKQHPKIFNRLYTNMVAAGESAGALDVVMGRLADFTEANMRLTHKVKGAMTYPIFILFFVCSIVGFLFAVVIPKIVKMFDDIKATLPTPTKVLIAISNFVAHYWWAVILIFLMMFFLFQYWKNTEKGRWVWHSFLLKMPILGDLILMISVSRFTKTLATMLSSGVPLLSAMEIVKNTINNVVIVKVLDDAKENIKQGHTIAEPLKRSGKFPPIVTHMIAIGERTGELEEMLEHVAESYDQQVNTKIDSLTVLLEPVLIAAMGGVVLFIVVSIMMPLLNLRQGF